MHQNHVTGRGRILDDLERYPIDFFDTFVKPRDTGFRIARSIQIPVLAWVRCSSGLRR